jgi:hypothetical protein
VTTPAANGTEAMTLPTRVEEITPAWLTKAVQGAFPGAEVRGLAQTAFIDGTAQKIRFDVTYASSGPVGPPSMWVKGGFDPKGAQQGDAFANEVCFFRDLAPRLDINLPGCFFGGVDARTNNGVVVLEDLLLRPATFGRATEPLSADRAAAVLAQQARLHARFWQSSEVTAFPWLRAGGAIAGAGVVDQYFGFWDASSKLPRFQFVTRAQRERDAAQTALNALMRELRDYPVCVVHGDSQGGNLFFDPDGQPGYLDWQHCMLGHWAFDLAGFLITAVTVEDRRAHERDLLGHYLRELTALGVAAPAFEAAWTDYARFAMWPFMWVMCPVEAHPEEVCSLNAERACAAIEDLGTLAMLRI